VTFLALRGGSGAGAGVPVDAASSSSTSIRVAYQGEPGAYSEKATRELLGEKVVAVGRQSFEACFRAVANMECDYACLPIENSLGGSIHENYDLMLRYDLKIVAEHEFRVKHCLMAKPGVKRDAIKYAISHPQALAQCDNFLRGLGITPIPTYDTAGSAKMISEGGKLPPNCTPENTAAIASDLAAKTYGLNCLDVGIEDDDTNFTRFLLLSRKAVHDAINSKLTPAKTSVVFTLHDTPGALYKALACFSLRDIDFSKIESRPTSASLLNFIKFKSQKMGSASRNQADLPRFRYCFYLDFLASQLDGKAKNALAHLNEQADYVRILGSYPQKSKLVGDVAKSVEELNRMVDGPNKENLSIRSLPSDEEDTKPLSIGLVGFDEFNQLLAKRFMEKHRVSCLDLKYDHTAVAKKLGVEYFSSFETSKFLSNVDVVVICVPLVDFEDTVAALPVTGLKGKLVVETCVLNSHPKSVLLRAFGKHADIDIISSHIMVGPHGGDETSIVADSSWDGCPMVYEKVRIANFARCEKYLKIFEEARCQIVEMSAEKHDASIADAEFVTHLTGRLLIDKQLLPPTPVLSKEYAALCDVADMTAGDSFDLFFGMFKFNDRARGHLTKMRDNLAALEQRLAAKEAYLAASIELRNNDRQRLIAETKLLLQEVVKNGVMQEENDEKEAEKVIDNTQKQQQQPTTNDLTKK
jgi:prephenate dehydratase/prephenate dehydrogenase